MDSTQSLPRGVAHFYTGWAPPDFNGVKIAMYRRGVCRCEGLRGYFQLQPGMFQDCVEIQSRNC